MFKFVISTILRFFPKKKPIVVPKKIISYESMMAQIDEADKKLYVGGESAFWLNPNRYGKDGKYDLFADPYVMPNVSEKTGMVFKQYGKWAYTKTTTKYSNKSNQYRYNSLTS